MQETQLRTITKIVAYRIISIATSVIITLLFGATAEQAAIMGLIVLLKGSIIYYVYDRVWLRIKWQRTSGVDSKTRSIVKTILYRIVVLLSMVVTARLVFIDSTAAAFVVALIKSGLNMISYFIIERIFNAIKWGKIP